MSIHPYVVLFVLVRDKACSCFATNFLDHQTLSMLQYELLKAICLSDWKWMKYPQFSSSSTLRWARWFVESPVPKSFNTNLLYWSRIFWFSDFCRNRNFVVVVVDLLRGDSLHSFWNVFPPILFIILRFFSTCHPAIVSDFQENRRRNENWNAKKSSKRWKNQERILTQSGGKEEKNVFKLCITNTSFVVDVRKDLHR